MKKEELENAIEVEFEVVDDNGQSSNQDHATDNHSNSKQKQDEAKDTQSTQSAQPTSKIKAWLPLIIAVAYALFPIDIIPDQVPVLGYFEDVLFVIIAALNGMEKSTFANNEMLQKILKYIKWGLLSAGLVAVIIIVLLVVVLAKTVSS